MRDAQSLLATLMCIEDMLPIAPKLDRVGFSPLESWGGATFDACIRYLGEDPWERLRSLKAATPNTPQQMLLHGQNLLGYRHYADDLPTHFESQLREQGASDRPDEVLAEITRVREDLGCIPLVTPTSRIVGTQAVLNVLTAEPSAT